MSSAETTGSEAMVEIASTQSTGRLKVQMPTARRPGRSGSRSAYQPASTTVQSWSAVRSNQYQPPSTNGVRSRSSSTSRSVPETAAPVTWTTLPSAFVR